jgi:hypothetical protein
VRWGDERVVVVDLDRGRRLSGPVVVDEVEPTSLCPNPPPLRGWEDKVGNVDPLEDV